MSGRHRNPIVRERGFTLIETIIIITVLGIAAVAIVSLNANIFSGQTGNKDLQVGVELMQECAEQVLATRRANGYSAASLANSAAATASCNGMTLAGYGAPTVTIIAGNSTTANMGACPYATGSNCKLVSVTQGGLTPVFLLLVGP